MEKKEFTDKFHNPCKDCEKRHEKCHSECAAYIEWSTLNQKLREEEYKIRHIQYELSDMKKKQINAAMRDRKSKKRRKR